MGPDVKVALKIQSLDLRITELKREIAQLPKHIAEIEKQLVAHERRLEVDQAAMAANEKERRKLEGDIKSFEEKTSKLKNQMLQASTNEQYKAFQNEIRFAEESIRKSEDRILELMEESETLAEAVEKAESALKAEKQEVQREAESARERTAADEKELAEKLAERKGLVPELNPKIYDTYERIRKRFGLPVLTEGNSGRCSACNIALRPQFFQDLKRANEPVRCENCWRLLYYHPTIDVEAEQAPAS